MALVSGQKSATLNPKAPMYVPAIYWDVEDFSAEWCELMKSSAWFRDYWLSVSQVEKNDDVVDDMEAEFEEMVMVAEAQEKKVGDRSFDRPNRTNTFNGLNVDVKTMLKDTVVPNSLKERSPRSPIGPAKYQMKAAKYVRTKSAPRFIHQPR